MYIIFKFAIVSGSIGRSINAFTFPLSSNKLSFILVTAWPIFNAGSMLIPAIKIAFVQISIPTEQSTFEMFFIVFEIPFINEILVYVSPFAIFDIALLHLAFVVFSRNPSTVNSVSLWIHIKLVRLELRISFEH